MKSRVVLLFVLVGLLGLPGTVTSGAGADPVGDVLTPPPTYPDLVPDGKELFVDRPIIGVDPETTEFIYGPRHVFFDTMAKNLGTVPLDLIADDQANLATSTTSQCTSWTATYVCRERRQVGGFAWHEEHQHFHFQDFARYELRRVRRDDAVDYRKRGLLAISDKVSFCIIDVLKVSDDALPVPTYTGFCGPTRQGISPGWADVYTASVPGQGLPVEGLSDGRYAIVIVMDPANRLWESDDTNNVVEVVFDLSNGGTQVTVVERRWP